MAFTMPNLRPQLISTNLSQGLGELGAMIGQQREDAAIGQALADLKSDDPASVDAAISRLMTTGPKGIDLAVKMREQQAQAKSRAAAEGRAERTLGIAERREGREVAAEKRAIEGAERFQKNYQDIISAPIPTEPARRSSEDEPTVYTPGNDAVRSRFWDEPPVAPGPRSEVAPLVGGAPVGFSETPADTGLSQAARREPQPLPETTEERALAARINRLQQLISDPDAPPGQVRAVERQLDALNRSREGMAKRRDDVYQKRLRAFEDTGEKERASYIDARKKELESLDKESTIIRNETNTANQLKTVINSPEYSTGTNLAVKKLGAKAIEQGRQVARDVGFPVDLEGTTAQRKFLDPVELSRRAETLRNQMVIAKSGDKGVGGQGFTDKDRDYVQRAWADPDVDNPQTMRGMIAATELINKRKEEVIEIKRVGLARGKSQAEIAARIKRLEEEEPLFVNKDGSLTEAARRLNPALARGEDAQRGAVERARATAPREGAVIEHSGKRWRFLGGDPSKKESWRAE